MKRIFVSIIAALWLVGLTAIASPVRPFPFSVHQPDGTTLTIHPHGDEYMSYLMTADGYAVARTARGYCYVTSWGADGAVTDTVLAHNPSQRGATEQQWLAANGVTRVTTSVAYARSRSRAMLTSIGTSSRPAGDVTYPVVLVEYKDVKFYFNDPVDTFTNYFNKEGYAVNNASGSVHDYFTAQSLGKYTPHYKIVARVTLSQNRNYYGAPSGNAHDSHIYDMVREAVDSARAQGVNFSQYESDNGDVPLVGVLVAGEGEQSCPEVTEAVWAAFYSYSISYGLGRIDNFLVTNELTHPYKLNETTNEYELDYSVSDLEGLGTFCHEFSHFLGLPDFYNVNNSNASFCMDYWSLMDYGQFANNGFSPVGYTAYEKNFMGWLDIPVLPTKKQVVRLGALGTEGENAYRIDNDSDKTGCEYYIVENRQPSRWYPRAFGSGMLVLHVDYSRSAWENNTVNTDPSHLRMTVIPADGSLVPIQDSPHTYDYKGDLFPGYKSVTSLSDTTAQTFAQYTGSAMGKYLTNITDTSGVVSFVYMARGILPAPESASVAMAENSAVLSWPAVAGAESYKVVLKAGDNELSSSEASGNSVNIGANDQYKSLTATIVATAPDYIDSAPFIYSFDNPVGIHSPQLEDNGPADVYSIDGVLLRQAVSRDKALGNLPAGLYILRTASGSVKVRVK